VEKARMDLIDSIVTIAREAGERILEIYAREDFGTTAKADDSPLTLADRAANELIVTRLAELEPALPIVTEESESAPYAERAGWNRFWLVDPLDGTKEFIKRNGEFTVNIALIEAGLPVLGVVHTPVLGITYYAAAGKGAFKREGHADPQPIAVSDYRSAGLKVVASRSHAGELMPRFLEALGDPQCISKGSSLKLCLVADGSANLYPRFGPTMEWDIAAAHAVVNEAGGSLVAIDGGPVTYGKEDMHNPFFVVAGRPPYPWRPVLAELQAETV
jgi:3'(2'), 5'-bisphosphate nucleotidase